MARPAAHALPRFVVAIELDAGHARCTTVCLPTRGPLPLPADRARGLGVVDVREVLELPDDLASPAAAKVLADAVAVLGGRARGSVGRVGLAAASGIAGMPVRRLAARLALRTRLPVVPMARGTALAWAEHRAHGGGDDSVLAIEVGASLSAGAVLHGVPFAALTGIDLAHMPVGPLGPPCACGRRGCLEVYAGHAGLERLAEDRDVPPVEVPIHDLHDAGRARDLALRAAAGEARAQAVIEEATRSLVHVADAVGRLLGVDRIAVRMQSAAAWAEVLRQAGRRRGAGPRFDASPPLAEAFALGAAAFAQEVTRPRR
ncbi:MAG: ROK family protein [Myxococcales bacterium]|nr:ROK family protein [Myxococcales bacterium]